MMQNKVEELQHYIVDIHEGLKRCFEEHLSPDVMDLIKKFIDRCNVLLNQQAEVNGRYNLKVLSDSGSYSDANSEQDSATYLLSVIKRKLSLLDEARTECMLNGTLEAAEHDFCLLEKAYLDLKVDIESFMRLQQLKGNKKN